MKNLGDEAVTDSASIDEIAGDDMLDAATGGSGAADTFGVTVEDGYGGIAVPVVPA